MQIRIVRRVTYPGVWILLTAVGVFFSQSDIAHTVFSSYALLNGHILDFYDFNAKMLVGNDYQVVLYAAIAIWMSPIHALGLATPSAHYEALNLNIYELVWIKAALVTLLFVAANLLSKIIRLLSPVISGRVEGALVLSSPLVLFPVVIMGQYDVIGLVLTLIAIHAWLTHKNTHFLVALSLATCFKYFPLLLLGPLLIFRANSVRRALGELALVLAPLAAHFLVFSSNLAFQKNIGRQPAQILGFDGTSYVAPLGRLALFAVALVGVFIIKRRFSWFFEDSENLLMLSYTVFSFVFVVVRWNPQWLIYLVPFWIVLLLKTKWSKLSLAIETLGFAGLMIMTANIWANNLDESMIQFGPLAGLLPDRVLRLNQIFQPWLLPYGVGLAYVSIVAPPILYWLQRLKGVGTEASSNQFTKYVSSKVATFALLSLLPMASCFVMPTPIAYALGANESLNSLIRTRSSQFHSQLMPLAPGAQLEVDHFYVAKGTRAFSIDFNTGGATVAGLVMAELVSANSQLAPNSQVFRTNLKGARDSSFPGYRGWLEVDFSKKNFGTLIPGDKTLKITNKTTHVLNIWLDSVRPTSGEVRNGDQLITDATVVAGFYSSKISGPAL